MVKEEPQQGIVDEIDPEFQNELGVDLAASGDDIGLIRSIMRQTQVSIKQV